MTKTGNRPPKGPGNKTPKGPGKRPPAKGTIDIDELDTEIDKIRKNRVVASVPSIHERIRAAREKLGISQDELAARLNRHFEVSGEDDTFSRSSIAQWETERARPRPRAVTTLAKVLKTTPEFLEFGITKPEMPDYVLLPETKFEDINGREIQKWGTPISWLKQEIGVTDLDKVIVYKIEVNGDPFEYGDRVLIDRSNQRPTPPGHFLYWDGVGALVAHMMIVPGGKKHTVKVTSAEGSFETELSKLQIIGRVRGVWKKA